MDQILRTFFKLFYHSIFSPTKLYSEIVSDASKHDLYLFGGVYSILTSFSIGLWFTFTASLFGLNSAGGIRELLLFTLIGSFGVIIVLLISAYLTKISASLLGSEITFTKSLAAYIFALPSFFILIQIPVINILIAPFYIIYVQVIGISNLGQIKKIEAGLIWTIQSLIQGFILLIPLTILSFYMLLNP